MLKLDRNGSQVPPKVNDLYSLDNFKKFERPQGRSAPQHFFVAT